MHVNKNSELDYKPVYCVVALWLQAAKMSLRFIFSFRFIFLNTSPAFYSVLAICDFEADICDWVQDQTDQFDWTRDRNGTTSASTGPHFDHTTNSQYGK